MHPSTPTSTSDYWSISHAPCSRSVPSSRRNSFSEEEQIEGSGEKKEEASPPLQQPLVFAPAGKERLFRQVSKQRPLLPPEFLEERRTPSPQGSPRGNAPPSSRESTFRLPSIVEGRLPLSPQLFEEERKTPPPQENPTVHSNQPRQRKRNTTFNELCEQTWILQANALLTSHERVQKQLVPQLIEYYKKYPFLTLNLETHRLYVQLHMLTAEQEKTAFVFFEFIRKFRNDSQIWKLFVLFVCRNNPIQARQLLNRYSFSTHFQKFTWYRKAIQFLEDKKIFYKEPNLPEKLNECAPFFAHYSHTPYSQWILATDELLTSENPSRDVVQQLSKQFDREFSTHPWAVEIRRLRFQLSLLEIRLLIENLPQKVPFRSNKEIMQKVNKAQKLFSNSFPRDPLVWKEYLLFLVNVLKSYEGAKKFIDTLEKQDSECQALLEEPNPRYEILKKGFSNLHWIQQLKEKIQQNLPDEDS